LKHLEGGMARFFTTGLGPEAELPWGHVTPLKIKKKNYKFEQKKNLLILVMLPRDKTKAVAGWCGRAFGTERREFESCCCLKLF